MRASGHLSKIDIFWQGCVAQHLDISFMHVDQIFIQKKSSGSSGFCSDSGQNSSKLAFSRNPKAHLQSKLHIKDQQGEENTFHSKTWQKGQVATYTRVTGHC